MAKAEFKSYGGKSEFLKHEEGKVDAFISKNGDGIDPYGDFEKKKADALDMNAGIAFNKADYTKIDVMGTEAPKKKYNQVEEHQDGEHFVTEEDDHNINPYGTESGKEKSFQTTKRK